MHMRASQWNKISVAQYFNEIKGQIVKIKSPPPIPWDNFPRLTWLGQASVCPSRRVLGIYKLVRTYRRLPLSQVNLCIFCIVVLRAQRLLPRCQLKDSNSACVTILARDCFLFSHQSDSARHRRHMSPQWKGCLHWSSSHLPVYSGEKGNCGYWDLHGPCPHIVTLC